MSSQEQVGQWGSIENGGGEQDEEEQEEFECEEPFRQEGGPLFNLYFSVIERRRKIVVGFWFIVLCWSLWVGPSFLSMGNDSQQAPSGTRAFDDQQLFSDRFASKSREIPVLVVVGCNSCNFEWDLDGRRLLKALGNAVREYNQTHANVLSLMGYLEGSLRQVKRSFLSPDTKTTFIAISVDARQVTTDRHDFISWLKDTGARLNPDTSEFTVGVTGFDAMALEGLTASAEEIKKVDIFTVPLAMALLAYMVRSWRLLLVAFFNLGTSIMFGFSIMVVLIKWFGLPKPESASAQLMEVMALSLSIDYCLFLCRRFRDEVKVGATTTEAVYRSMLTAGHVVGMSGLTILAVFLGFLFLPAQVVRMDGIACAVGVSCAILVALTNTPALILTFPEFFSTFDGCCGYGIPSAAKIGNENDDENSLHENGDTATAERDWNERQHGNNGHVPLLEGMQVRRVKVHPMYAGLRFRLTSLITRWPWNIVTILVLYALVIPLAVQVGRLQVNEDILSSIPRHSAAGDAFRRMVNAFPGGTFSPFYVLATEPSGTSILNHQMFSQLQSVAEKIQHTKDCAGAASCVSNPAFVRGRRISLFEAKGLLMVANTVCSKKLVAKVLGPVCEFPLEYKFLFEENVNEARDAVLTTVILPYFPFAQNSSDFIDSMYDILDAHQGEYGVEQHLCGFEVGFDSTKRHVYGLFPMLVAVTLCTVFLVLGLMLRSAFVPVRLALTLVLPLAAIFGLAVMVYQDGILKDVSEATKPTGGFFWYLPILVTSISCGLCLDYDVFLISRIQEHRAAGYDARASIVKAVCETGGTISAAGLIMIACFGGLLLSSQGTINEAGWLLSTGVILDTFVVNVFLVPALMSMGDSVAWWPTKMPMEDLKTLEDVEFTGMYVIQT